MSTMEHEVVIEQAGAQYHLTRNEAGEAVVKDLELARWLGFERQYEIRRLIERHVENLGEVFVTATKTSDQGGRPGTTYYLTEQQALFIAAKSETPRATEVLKQIIEVFVAVRRGGVAEHAVPAALPASMSASLPPSTAMEVEYEGTTVVFTRRGALMAQPVGIANYLLEEGEQMLQLFADRPQLMYKPWLTLGEAITLEREWRKARLLKVGVEDNMDWVDATPADVEGLWAAAERQRERLLPSNLEEVIRWHAQQAAQEAVVKAIPKVVEASIAESSNRLLEMMRGELRGLMRTELARSRPEPVSLPALEAKPLMTTTELVMALGMPRSHFYRQLAARPELCKHGIQRGTRTGWPIDSLPALMSELQWLPQSSSESAPEEPMLEQRVCELFSQRSVPHRTTTAEVIEMLELPPSRTSEVQVGVALLRLGYEKQRAREKGVRRYEYWLTKAAFDRRESN